jgi:uncharacterized radical SAM protein YgiQ
MISRQGKDFDVILITGEYWDDHPLSPVGAIARVLDSGGYSVGIIEKPSTHQDVVSLGRPRLFFGVTTGSIDSMVHNYTPLKRKREADEYGRVTPLPDRAMLVYCNHIKQEFKDVPIVLGGIEASLRRFAHYDYWDNKLRRSILLDSRADILVYGNGEKQVLEIAGRLDRGEELLGVKGSCVLSREIPEGFQLLPSWDKVKGDRVSFCQMQAAFSNKKDLAQEYTNNYLLQFRYPEYTTEDLDHFFSLPFSRTLHPGSLLKMARFSVVTHRGCLGACSFCSISLHQGQGIISRSEENILQEVRGFTKHPDFWGYVDDLGGPSANMYGMDCETHCGGGARRSCFACKEPDTSHRRLVDLMRKVRAIPGVKKVFVRSGVRYDLAMNSEEYIRELSGHHVSGCLKIAPEHFSPKVLELMNKKEGKFQEFVSLFDRLNQRTGQELRYYLMVGHPGDDPGQLQLMIDRLKGLRNIEQFQLFTPTPMTVSSCMYWTGLNPNTLEEVVVVHDYGTKKKMKRMMLKVLERDSLGRPAQGRAGARSSTYEKKKQSGRGSRPGYQRRR